MMAPGMFGVVDVIDVNGARQLRINGQVQGAAFLDPPSKHGGPGVVSASPYTLGWLAAAAMNPRGRGLMIGLGSGAGAVAVLTNFPGVRIDVIEIDPVAVHLCKQGFPEVNAAIESGRLRVFTADALAMIPLIAGSPRDNYPYDFILHDAYDGKSLITGDQVAFFKACAAITRNIWINIIGRPNIDPMKTMLQDLVAAGVAPRSLLFADFTLLHPFDTNTAGNHNWIVSTQETDPGTLDAFVPYADLEGDTPEAKRNLNGVRVLWERVLLTEINGSDLDGYIAGLDAQ